jgi:monoamine oxidase
MVAESMSKSRKAKTVAVFGGCISGLTVAHEFSKLGYKVKVFEANPDVGTI